MSESNIISETLDLKIKKVNAKESKKCLESLEFWTDCILKSLLLEYDLQKSFFIFYFLNQSPLLLL